MTPTARQSLSYARWLAFTMCLAVGIDASPVSALVWLTAAGLLALPGNVRKAWRREVRDWFR